MERLRGGVPCAAKRILAASVWKTLSRHLTERLAFVLAHALLLEQRATKAVTGCENATLLETFATFPGALETVAQLLGDWIEAQGELLKRLLRDRSVIRSTFLRDRAGFRVVAIRPGLSDPHDGGRTVTLIEFAGQNRVIYKPRSLVREKLWFAALRWLNRKGFQTQFRIPRSVSRKEYSWMEFVERLSCRDDRQVRLFYFRWGAQTALAQMLGASDLHRENWIAAGAHPVLVDAELIVSGPNDRQSLPALLETGLLPLTARDRAGFYEGIAPLDATLGQAATARCWPRYKGALRTPAKYVDDLVTGFEAVANIFANRELTRGFFTEIVLRMTQGANVRMLFRASAQYARLLRESLEAKNMFLRNQRKRWLMRECARSAAHRAIGRAEAEALLRCDVPKFTARMEIAATGGKRFQLAVASLTGSSAIVRRRVVLRPRVCR